MFFVCFMSMLGRFRSISSNLGFHAAEGITANLCDANTQLGRRIVADFSAEDFAKANEVIGLSMDNIWRSTQLYYISAPLLLYSIIKGRISGKKKWPLKESIYWCLPYVRPMY